MTQDESRDRRLEDEVLLKYLRIFLGFERSIDLKELPHQDVNWDDLIQTADGHKVMPLLYRSIYKSDPDAIPEESLKMLRADFDGNAFANLALTGELLRLLDLFETHGISAIPFKGPLLSSYLYKDISLRQFLDLDVLVPLDRVGEVKEQLISRGYVQERELKPAEERVFLKYKHHHNFYHPDLGVNLEIHWRLSPRIYSVELEPSDLWDRAERVSFFGREVLSFSPEDTILTLCEHGTRHYWGRLAWICDVASLVTTKKVDWNAAVERARDVGCERVLFLGLALARELLNAPIPSEISRLVDEDRAAASLADEAMERLFQESSPPRGSDGRPSSEIGEELFYVRARERLKDRTLYYMRRATYPTENEWDFISLPEPLFILYYLIRPLRMIGKYRLRIWKWFER